MNKSIKLIAILAPIISIITGTTIIYEKYINVPTDISGNWEIKFEIYKSSYRPYVGKSMTFKLFFTQNENEIEGKGEKWWIDDKEIPFEQHDPIQLKGTIDGNKLICTFILKGTKRETTGIIEAEILKDTKSMEGTFSGTAANSKGPIRGVKK